MLNKLKNWIRYCGLTPEEYTRYRRITLEQDDKNLEVYLPVSAFVCIALTVGSALIHNFAGVNLTIYAVTALALLLLLLLRGLVRRLGCTSIRCRVLFVYLYMGVMYAEAMAVTMLHPDQPAVTYIAILLMLPLLFAQSPIHTILVQMISVTVFCILVRRYKFPEIAYMDCWNAITYLGVSILALIIVIPIRIGNLVRAEIIKEISGRDLLTGLRNRNSFETDFPELAARTPSPVVIYADANGLHELNNNYGHEAGDAMLRALAGAMKDAWGDRWTYRLGGDEFISLTFDIDLMKSGALAETIRQELEKKDWHVSFGLAAGQLQGDDLDRIIRRAESRMYRAKDEYYQTTPRAPR